MTDEELLNEIRLNPSHGISLALDLYGDNVKYIVKNILGAERQQDIEECISDVFIELWRAVTIRKENVLSVRAYLKGIAKNKAVDKLRKLLRSSGKETASLIEDYTDDPEGTEAENGVYTDLCERASDKEAAGIIKDELESLSDEDKAYATDKFCKGKSVNEIAVQRKTSARHVTKRLSECRRKFKEALLKKGMVTENEK